MLEGVGIAVPGPSHRGSVRASSSNGGGSSTRHGTDRNSMASVEVHEKIEMNWI